MESNSPQSTPKFLESISSCKGKNSHILSKNLSRSSACGSPSMKTYASAASPPAGSDSASSAIDVPVSQQRVGLGPQEAEPPPLPPASLLPPSVPMLLDEWRRRLPKRKRNDGAR